MMRHSFHSHRVAATHSSGLCSADKKALAVYVRRFAEEYPDLINTRSFIDIFRFVVKQFDKTEQLSKILQTQVIRLVEQHRLTPIKDSCTVEQLKADPQILTNDELFKEDIDISRLAEFSYDSETGCNLGRCLFKGEKDLFVRVMGIVLFTDTVPVEFPDHCALPVSFRHAADEVKGVSVLSEYVGLSVDESRLLLLLHRIEIVSELRSLCEEIGDDSLSVFGSIVLDIPEHDILYMLRSDQPLLTFGLVLSNERERIRISPEAEACLALGDTSAFFTDVLSEVSPTSYPLESFSVRDTDASVASRLLAGSAPVNILLYGEPGAGKTEFAKSLIKKSGKRMLLFKNDNELQGSNKVICALNRIALVNQGTDTVIVVDEADKILDTGLHMFMFFQSGSSSQKGPINKMLENNKNQFIWIVNRTDQMDDSTRRRFTYSIKFEAMPESTLYSIAEQKISSVPMSETLRTQILDMCTSYKMTGASVDNMVKMIGCLDLTDEKKAADEINTVFEANSRLLYGEAKMREKSCTSYDLSVLNTSSPAAQIVDMVQNAQQYAERNKNAENGIRMLFYGVSGTGKTEFARYIAEQLHKKLLLKRASDILGMYVGQTEANIRKAFQEASANGQILLFDEADSFFADRNSANHSWERTMTNEFLTQMEEFKGILICTTNLRNIMDPAMQRRFHLCVEFKPLTETGIATMLGKYFNSSSFDSSQVAELAALDSVTPGDFGALSSRVRFMNNDEVTADYLVRELAAMQKEKPQTEGSRRKIGFGE